MKLVDVDKLEKAMTIAAANCRDEAQQIWEKAICVLHDADVSYRITCNNGNQRTLINP